MDYADHLEKVKDLYEPKIRALLKRIREVLEDEGLTVHDPYFLDGDYYSWSMTVHRHPGDHADDDGADITVEIAEERYYDDPEGWGINFGLDVVDYGGIILGGLTPFNYSPEVWVDSRNPDAVLARWHVLEDADISDIPDLIITDDWEWDEDGYYKKEKS
jgi:hypothetical protein